VNKDLAESFGLPRPAGALVAQIMPDGPGDKGGLQVGDVILKLNDQDIVMSSDLPHAVGRLRPGIRATMQVMRGGKREQLTVEFGAPTAAGALSAPDAAARDELSSTEIRLGLAVVKLTTNQ